MPGVLRRWAYTASLLLVTLLASLLFPWLPSLSWSTGFGLAILFAMILASDWFSVLFSFGSTSAKISVGSAACFGLTLWLGPTLGSLAAALSMVIVGRHRSTTPRIIIENSTSVAAAAFVSGWTYMVFTADRALPLSDFMTSVAVVAAACAYAVVNFGTIVAGITWDSGQSLIHLARKLSGGYHFLLSIPILGAIIPIVGSVSPLGLLIIPLPLAGAYLAMDALGRLRKETDATLSSLIDALELRDAYTSFHSTRVTLYVQTLLDQITDLPPSERERITLAARLHDIGKVAVRDAILLKPGALTHEERLEMQSHPGVGADLIGHLDTYRPCVDVIRHHHERWDGNGYPDKLVDEQIPLGARVIAIADSFDAMTTDRPYRSALSFDDAIAELVRNRGIQFDSGLVDSFVRGLSLGEFLEIREAGHTSLSVAS